MKTLLFLFLLPLVASAQGPLAPPSTAGGPVGPIAPLNGGGASQPTMKTLHQVEPRIALQTIAAAPPYVIFVPGSYYLTDNITVANGTPITISSSGVTLDLNGFCIRSERTGSMFGTAVSIAAGYSGITIRNGSIASGSNVPASGAPTTAGFQYGIEGGSQVLVSDVHVRGVGSYGIFLTKSSVVERCTVAHCSTGIYVTEARDCSATRCSFTGIQTDVATNCSGSGITGSGVVATTATNCRGTSVSGEGVAAGHAVNCHGTSTSSRGLRASFNAVNCIGASDTGVGIDAGNATNCVGTTGGTGAGAVGIVGKTATSCRGVASGGGASKAFQVEIAISCTFSGTAGLPIGKSFDM